MAREIQPIKKQKNISSLYAEKKKSPVQIKSNEYINGVQFQHDIKSLIIELMDSFIYI